MTDIEHAKKYAESISLAISMYNPKAEIIAETACLYGFTYKNKQIADLEQKLEQAEKDLSDYQFNYPTIKESQKENTELKEKLRNRNCLDCSNHHSNIQLIKAKELLKEFMRISVASCEEYEPEFSELIGQTEEFLNGKERA